MSNPLSKLTKRLSLGGKKSASASTSTSNTNTNTNTNTASTSTATPSQPPSQPPPSQPAAATSSTPTTQSKSIPDYSVQARSLQSPKDSLRKLYPKIEPYESGNLDVGDGHSIYYEWSGNKQGWPAVFLHGGPGGGVSPDDRRWFDPSHYRVLTFDQRGAGKSTPAASLENNTTWDLVSDIEKLREKFQIAKWHVFGGSWGSTLSLAYSQSHPSKVSALILRGIFTLRSSELSFFYQNGASHLFPEQFQPYLDFIPKEEQSDLITAYGKRLIGEDEDLKLEAARKWSTWENSTSKLYLDEEHIKKGDDDQWALQFARIENHYFINKGWMEDGQLLKKENIDKIRNIPTFIAQGRYDIVCPCTTAFELQKVFPEADFNLVPDAGHSAKEPGIMDLLIKATDEFKSVS